MTMCMSGAIDQLATALAKAQGEIEDASKNAKNPHFGNKYADLSEVLGTLRPVLSRHGLAIVQFPGPFNKTDGTVALTTVLTHSSGQYMFEQATIPLAKCDPQGEGGGLTYLRRYADAAVGCIAQIDDDGETANGRGDGAAKGRKKAPSASPPAEPAAPADLAALRASFEAIGKGDVDKMKELAVPFSALNAADQAALLPVVKEARARATAK